MDLYEKIDLKKEFCSNNNKKKNSLKNNIIGVNLLKSEKSKVYGINTILNATLHILKK